MYYKLEFNRDLDVYYPEIQVILNRVSLLGKHTVIKTRFHDDGLIAEVYSEQYFRKKEKAILAYNNYVQKGKGI